MNLDFPAQKPRRFLDPAFHGENPLHVKRFLENLLTNPPSDFASANSWFSLFHEGSLAINDIHTKLELATQLDTTSQEAQTRLRMFEEKVLSQLLTTREALLDIYLESPWRLAMHADDKGRIEKELRARKNFSKPALAKLQIKENELIRNYKRFVHTSSAPHEGERAPLPILVGKMQDADAKIRESAFLSYWSFIRDNESSLQELFSELLANRKEQAQVVQERSYIPIAFAELGRHDYSPEDCAIFRSAIERSIVPKLVSISKDQRESLGTNTLRPWNAASWPAITPQTPPANGNPQQIIPALERVAHDIHPAFGKIFTRMNKLGTLHIFPAVNKAPGAFCVTLQESGVPFIFANISATGKDVMTILHEFGHAVHGYAGSFIPNTLQRTPGMDFCEVMSTGMEVLSFNHLHHLWPGKRDAQKTQAQHLFGMLNFWPFMAMVDEWQHAIYTSEESMNPAFRNRLWKTLSQRYRPHLDWSNLEELEPLGWFARPHIFTSPFYYIDYGVAQIGALQFWKMQKEDPQKTLQAYITGLCLGAQRSLPELFEACHMRFEFSQTLLEELARHMEETIKNALE
jgi:oligoendopeptidase F